MDACEAARLLLESLAPGQRIHEPLSLDGTRLMVSDFVRFAAPMKRKAFSERCSLVDHPPAP
jgi:hypothetical protein